MANLDVGCKNARDNNIVIFGVHKTWDLSGSTYSVGFVGHELVSPDKSFTSIVLSLRPHLCIITNILQTILVIGKK